MNNVAISLSKVKRAEGYHILYLMPYKMTSTGPWKVSVLCLLNFSGARERGQCLTHPWESSRVEMAALIDLHAIIVSYLRRETGPHRDCSQPGVTLCWSQEGCRMCSLVMDSGLPTNALTIAKVTLTNFRLRGSGSVRPPRK